MINPDIFWKVIPTCNRYICERYGEKKCWKLVITIRKNFVVDNYYYIPDWSTPINRFLKEIFIIWLINNFEKKDQALLYKIKDYKNDYLYYMIALDTKWRIKFYISGWEADLDFTFINYLRDSHPFFKKITTAPLMICLEFSLIWELTDIKLYYKSVLAKKLPQLLKKFEHQATVETIRKVYSFTWREKTEFQVDFKGKMTDLLDMLWWFFKAEKSLSLKKILNIYTLKDIIIENNKVSALYFYKNIGS